MDENRVQGAATNIGGKVKDAVGGMLGDSKLQGEGKADQVSGQAQNAYGSAKDSIQEGVQSLGSQEPPPDCRLGSTGSWLFAANGHA